MKIGLISDIHAQPIPLKNALKILDTNQVDIIYNLGDTAGYFEDLEECITILKERKIISIFGNHDQWYLDLDKSKQEEWIVTYFKTLATVYNISFGNISIQLNHEAPEATDIKGLKLLDQFGKLIPERIDKWKKHLNNFKPDILIVGHTHQVFAEQIGETLVVNPGSTAFNNSCAILTLPEKKVQFYALSDAGVNTTWNWSNIKYRAN